MRKYRVLKNYTSTYDIEYSNDGGETWIGDDCCKGIHSLEEAIANIRSWQELAKPKPAPVVVWEGE